MDVSELTYYEAKIGWNMVKRDLTTLEYIVLGLVSLQPQSGYSITSFFEDGAYTWSASPGSIYPMLKRLEDGGMILGELEMEHETRPRKVYTLTETGGNRLDEWLTETPGMRPFYGEREIAMLRFQFMERRLPHERIMRWINDFIDAVNYASRVEQVYTEPIKKAMEDDPTTFSLHSQLLMEAYIMEINTLRTWLELARTRLQLAHSQQKTSS
jgi:DNA-binding PadR family transcriptional regulator